MKIHLFFMFSLSTRSMTPNYLGTLIFMRKSCLPIGFIRSALKCRDGAPLQGLEGAPDALEMLPAYLEGLIVCNAATKSLSSPGFIALAGTCQSPCVQNGPPARSGVAHFVPFFATCGTVGTRSRAIRGSTSDDRVGCGASDGRCAPARPALHVSTRLLPFLPCALASADCIGALSINAPSVNVLRRTRRKPSTIRGAAPDAVIGQSTATRAGARPYHAGEGLGPTTPPAYTKDSIKKKKAVCTAFLFVIDPTIRQRLPSRCVFLHYW